jgi:hypothetical protein
MTGQLVLLAHAAWVEFLPPSDARPTDRLLPILIEDASLEEVEIYRNDVALVNLAHRPARGQVAAVETPQSILLGYCYNNTDGVIRVESVCGCARCGPRFITPESVLNYGPVSWISRPGVSGWECFAYRRVDLTPMRGVL